MLKRATDPMRVIMVLRRDGEMGTLPKPKGLTLIKWRPKFLVVVTYATNHIGQITVQNPVYKCTEGGGSECRGCFTTLCSIDVIELYDPWQGSMCSGVWVQ